LDVNKKCGVALGVGLMKKKNQFFDKILFRDSLSHFVKASVVENIKPQ